MDAPSDSSAETVRFEIVDPRSDDAIGAMTQYFEELERLFEHGFDPGDTLIVDAAAFDRPEGAFVVLRAIGRVIGCGGSLTLAPGIGEIKRMWIHPDWRGRGLARGLLERLEHEVSDSGNHTVRLDTNAVLAPAIAMYERLGYRPIDRYNDNPYAHHWFEKSLAST